MNFQVRILRPLLPGGFGDVFVGLRTDTGEQVVLKRLREWHIPHNREGFEREIRVLARGVTGLVPLLGWDLTAQPPYYVMPYLEGGALTQYAGRLTENQLQNVSIELAQILANLHVLNEVDGDFKPDNIFVTRNGQLQVGDPLGNGTIVTMLFGRNRGGTPGYWAPEIRGGEPISRAGDSYSYAATLYHMVTGRRPVDGQKLDPAAEGYRVDPVLNQVIAACSQFNPSARPTMGEVLRIFGGERWNDIRTERMQRNAFLIAACLIGGLLWLGTALKGGGRRI